MWCTEKEMNKEEKFGNDDKGKAFQMCDSADVKNEENGQGYDLAQTNVSKTSTLWQNSSERQMIFFVRAMRNIDMQIATLPRTNLRDWALCRRLSAHLGMSEEAWEDIVSKR